MRHDRGRISACLVAALAARHPPSVVGPPASAVGRIVAVTAAAFSRELARDGDCLIRGRKAGAAGNSLAFAPPSFWRDQYDGFAATVRTHSRCKCACGHRRRRGLCCAAWILLAEGTSAGRWRPVSEAPSLRRCDRWGGSHQRPIRWCMAAAVAFSRLYFFPHISFMLVWYATPVALDRSLESTEEKLQEG